MVNTMDKMKIPMDELVEMMEELREEIRKYPTLYPKTKSVINRIKAHMKKQKVTLSF